MRDGHTLSRRRRRVLARWHAGFPRPRSLNAALKRAYLPAYARLVALEDEATRLMRDVFCAPVIEL